jgi:hypothetical protein
MTTDPQSKSNSNPFLKLAHKVATADTQSNSELNPPENITPSTGTTISAILMLAPLSLFLIGLYFGVIDP